MGKYNSWDDQAMCYRTNRKITEICSRSDEDLEDEHKQQRNECDREHFLQLFPSLTKTQNKFGPLGNNDYDNDGGGPGTDGNATRNQCGIQSVVGSHEVSGFRKIMTRRGETNEWRIFAITGCPAGVRLASTTTGYPAGVRLASSALSSSVDVLILRK